MSILIRPATNEDLPIITAIYNQAVKRRGQTADLETISVEDRIEWFREHSPERYPILVAEHENDTIGWIALSAYRQGRAALKSCVEVSLYLNELNTGRGVGSDMLASMIALARELGYENMLAFIIASNEKSKGLFAKYKFEIWGKLPNVVAYDNQHFDHYIYGRTLLR